MFCLELFFETDRGTAAERFRTIARYVVFLTTVQIGIVLIFLLILYYHPSQTLLGT
jgi:hypothetical protein